MRGGKRDLLPLWAHWFLDEGRVPHISLVFREMWDTTNLDRLLHRMD